MPIIQGIIYCLFLAGLKSLNDELAREDAIIKQEADFLLMAETFGELITALYQYCSSNKVTEESDINTKAA